MFERDGRKKRKLCKRTPRKNAARVDKTRSKLEIRRGGRLVVAREKKKRLKRVKVGRECESASACRKRGQDEGVLIKIPWRRFP
jgi:hypothetical protein